MKREWAFNGVADETFAQIHFLRHMTYAATEPPDGVTIQFRTINEDTALPRTYKPQNAAQDETFPDPESLRIATFRPGSTDSEKPSRTVWLP
jgi:hypothetical protein